MHSRNTHQQRQKGYDTCGVLSTFYYAFRFIAIFSIICIFFYILPPYRIKQILDATWTATSAVGSVVSTIATDERKAEAFASHLTKSGRDLWTKVRDEFSSNAIPTLSVSG